MSRERASREPCCRSANGVTPGSSKHELTDASESLYCSGRLNKAVHDVPSPRRSGASPGRLVSDTIRFKKEASGASRRLFYAVLAFGFGARSLKTQQRSVQTSRPRPAQPLAAAGKRHNLVVPTGTTFEHELKVKRSPASCRQSLFTESLILAQDERWRRA